MTNCPESIRLYNFCKGTSFAVLPVQGGLYDQHPKLIEQWERIMAAEAEAEKKRQAQEQRRQKKTSSRPRRR